MGFLGKLWRGEVSLGTTYWVFGFVVVAMFQMLQLVPMESAKGAATLTFIASAYYVFIAVAIFRSSFRHKGSRLFIIFAQVSAAVLAGLALWNIFWPGGEAQPVGA